MLKKLLIFVLILIIFGHLSSSLPNTQTKVISDVVSKLFVQEGINFDFVILGKPSAATNDTINELILAHGHAKEIKCIQNLKKFTGKAALFFVESFTALLKYFSDEYERNFKALFFLPDSQKFYITSNSSFKSISQYRHESYFLVESETKFELGKIVQWTEHGCNVAKFSVTNFFDKSSRKWERYLDLSQKLPNFHGCPLKIFSNIFRLVMFEMIADAGYSFIDPNIKPTLEKRDEKEKEILKIFAEHLNFSIIQGRNRYDSDLDVLLSGEGEVSLECSNNFYDLAFQMMYSPPESYTNYEKMILPFDDVTWLYLILVFCSAFVGIFIINQTPKVFRDLVYGKNVNMPSFNVIGTMFGIGQTKLPDNNFGRIILMTFIMFCLIFRTAYQGKILELL